MRINDDDITKMLAELPEIDLPEGFHDEVMQKIHYENRRGELRPPAPKKNRRTIWYIGSLTTAAAAVIAILITVIGFENNWGQPEFTAVADAAPQIAPQATPTPAAEVRVRQAEPEPAGEAEADFYMGFYTDFNMDSSPEYGTLAEPFGIMTEMQMTQGRGSLDAQVWSLDLDDDAYQATSFNVFLFPDHLPTDLIDLNATYDGYVFMFQIVIAVDDVEYAQQAIRGMGAEDQMALRPPTEDLEATFVALYNLGVVEKYTITTTSTLVLSNMQHATDLLEAANTIDIFLLQN